MSGLKLVCDTFCKNPYLQESVMKNIFSNRELEFAIFKDHNNIRKWSFETKDEYIMVIWVSGHVFVSVSDVPDELRIAEGSWLTLIDPVMMNTLIQTKKQYPSATYGYSFMQTTLAMISSGLYSNRSDSLIKVDINKILETLNWKLKSGVKIQDLS